MPISLHDAGVARHGTLEAALKAVKNWTRTLRRAQTTVHHKLYDAVGGPFDGHKLHLSGPSTLPIQTEHYSGRYVSYRELDMPRRAYAEEVCSRWAGIRYGLSRAHFHSHEAPFVFWKDE